MIALPTYPHVIGKASAANLLGVLPALVSVWGLAIRLCPFDGTVKPNGGVRSASAAEANAIAGTGIRNSRHLKQPDGHGHAIDGEALIDVDGDGDGDRVIWTRLDAFRAMALAVKQASAILEIPIRQGCDWNMNGKLGEAGTKEWDWPHFEDPLPYLLKQATAEMERFRAEMITAGIDVRPETYAHAA